MIGRRQALEDLRRELPRRRLLTLAGAGGMGKTRLAIEVARSLADGFADGARFIDLSSLAEARFVAGRVAAAFDLHSGDSLDAAALASQIADTHALLVLDNCEHLLDGLAPLVTQLLQKVPRLRIIATSREPFGVPAERIHWLHPIATPPEEEHDSERALGYAAVALFDMRARAASPGFLVDDHNAADVSRLCRRLEGIPLAIELAAARSADQPLSELLSHIEAHLLASGGPSTGLAPRHDSVATLLDWSHGLLNDAERLTLHRLSVFQASFDFGAARAVACCPALPPAALLNALAGLASKSMLVVHLDHEPRRYAMLVTTRVYAAAKLAGGGDHTATMRRFTQHLLSVFEEGAARWPSMTREAWLMAYADHLDDVRLALRWASGVDGDARLFVQLTLATVHLAFLLSLLNEYRALIDLAIERLPALQLEARVYELRLRRAYGELVGQTVGSLDAMHASYDLALRLAEASGSAEDQLIALDGTWMGAFITGSHTRALRLARQCDALAQAAGDVGTQRRCRRMLSQSLHANGLHEEASRVAHAVLQDTRVIARGFEDSSVDPQISMRVVLARTLWIQGLADQAADVAAQALALGENDVIASMPHALAWAGCPVAIWRGELDLAETRVLALIARSREPMPYWHAWGQCYLAVLSLLRGSAQAAAVREKLLAVAGENHSYLDMSATLAPQLVTPQTWMRHCAGETGWCAPEILRTEALRLYAHGEQQPAREALSAALALAHRQGALSWQLRSATTAATWDLALAQPRKARDALASVRSAFTEGAATADLQRADALLARIESLL